MTAPNIVQGEWHSLTAAQLRVLADAMGDAKVRVVLPPRIARRYEAMMREQGK
jgi:hypothetical protein